mmetsp:Transcript_119002/g.333343  ORF Transcript_119002/g.333343 Transcript_119002/m.333343 type:complete len:80 (+) Transcript_119002:891-1130(+)
MFLVARHADGPIDALNVLGCEWHCRRLCCFQVPECAMLDRGKMARSMHNLWHTGGPQEAGGDPSTAVAGAMLVWRLIGL